MPAKLDAIFQRVIADLKAKKYAPFYLLMGEESYFIDKISDFIANNVLEPEMRDFNQTICFGSDVSCAQVVDMAKRYPMMAEHQVIIVKEAQNVRSLEPLEKYLSGQLVKSTILVWCHKNGSIDGKKKIVKLANAAGVVFDSVKLRDYQLPIFIQEYLDAKKVTIDPKAKQMVADAVGADLNRLTSELDKVMISLPENGMMITPDIVEKEIGISKDFNAFELRNAIVQKNIFKANQIIKYFDNNPKAGSLYSFLPMLFSYFRDLMIAHYIPGNKSEDALAAGLGLKSRWGAKDYMIGLRAYSARKTMDILGKVREIDAKSKGLDNPSTGSGDLMKELIFFILH